jgi:hypothetical protein
MPIPAQNPTTVPAVPEKSFSDLWLYNINIHSPAVNSGRIYIEALPYNPDVQEIGPSSGLEVISTDQLFQAAYDVPEVGIAYQAIIDAIVPLREWIAAQNAPQPPPVIEVVPEVLPEELPEEVPAEVLPEETVPEETVSEETVPEVPLEVV